MSDLNNNNNINENIDDIEKKIDSEIDKLVNDAISEAMSDNQDSESADDYSPVKEIDTDELLKAIKAGLKESLGAANILAKKGYDSAKSGIKDIAHSVKDKISSMQEAAKEAKEACENEESCECDESCECSSCDDENQCECDGDDKKEVKFDIKLDHKDGKFEGKFGSKEFKFDTKDFKFAPPHFKIDRKPDSYSLTMDFITSRIDMVINNTAHLMEAVDSIKNMPVNESHSGGIGDAEKAKTIRTTVELKEQTNREIIALLNKMYEDLMAPVRADRKDPKDAALDAHIARILENDMDANEKIELINAISQIYK